MAKIHDREIPSDIFHVHEAPNLTATCEDLVDGDHEERWLPLWELERSSERLGDAD